MSILYLYWFHSLTKHDGLEVTLLINSFQPQSKDQTRPSAILCEWLPSGWQAKDTSKARENCQQRFKDEANLLILLHSRSLSKIGMDWTLVQHLSQTGFTRLSYYFLHDQLGIFVLTIGGVWMPAWMTGCLFQSHVCPDLPISKLCIGGFRVGILSLQFLHQWTFLYLLYMFCSLL